MENFKSGLLAAVILLGALFSGCGDEGGKSMGEMEKKESIVFASFAESREGLDYIYYLAESIREFGGNVKDAPIWVYVPEDIEIPIDSITDRFASLKNVDVRVSLTPPDSRAFYYAGKVYAAGVAESATENEADILVWLDSDTILLTDPLDFRLPENIALAYRPIMHNRSGTLYDAPPNPFWKRIYEVLDIDEASLFPMITPADHQKVKAYFNAGLVVVRPEYGMLRKWGDDFSKLYHDPALVEMCQADIDKRIFLHQTALVGAVLNTIDRDQMIELSDRYNYPIFFDIMFGADRPFDSLENVVTLRYDYYFRDPEPDWEDKLIGDKKIIGWIKNRLGNVAKD